LHSLLAATPPPTPTPFPYTTLFRSREDLLFRAVHWAAVAHHALGRMTECERTIEHAAEIAGRLGSPRFTWEIDLNRGLRLLDHGDRKSTRLNSSHRTISYAVFCLKK